jgi:hypothetical protein
MSEQTKRVCCFNGCNTEREKPSDGYRASLGFMMWACDVHAEVFRTYDESYREYKDEKGEKWEEASTAFHEQQHKEFVNFEDKWDEDYIKENPEPEEPPSQQSIK